MKKTILILVVALGVISTSCTDTTRASFGAYGSAGKITCHSGGKVIYEGESTGRIQTVSQSDGWEFKEKGSGDFIRVSGDCVIRN